MGTLTTFYGYNYKGQWYQGLQQGTGTMVDTSSGQVFEGQYYEGKRLPGPGVMTYKNGVKYDGEWNDEDEKCGKGKLVYPNGLVVEGKWFGRLNGEVSVTKPDGSVRKVEFAVPEPKEPIRRVGDYGDEYYDYGLEEEEERREGDEYGYSGIYICRWIK